MNVILAGPNNKIAMAAPGRPMLAAPLPSTVSSGGDLSSIAGLSGWWDASEPAGVLDPTGMPLTAFGASASGVADKSGAGAALTVWHQASSGTTPPIATPRLNGLLGGIGLNMLKKIAQTGTLPTSGKRVCDAKGLQLPQVQHPRATERR
jgi:hypothetical protein